MSDPLLFQGKIIYPEKSIYAILIFPFAQLKKLFQSLYYLLLKVMWTELIQGKKTKNDLAGIVFFLILLVLSWLTYLGKAYFPLIFIGFFIIWYLDYSLAKSDYQKGKYSVPIKLMEKEGDRFLWKLALPNQKLLQSELNWGQIRRLVIDERSISAGAFQENIGKVWQISLQGFDDSEWIIDEEKTVTKAFNQARLFTQWIKVPIIFQGSQGQNEYAEYLLNSEELEKSNPPKPAVKIQQNQQKWHLTSVWRLRHSWALFKQIVQESGFVLFVLLMSKIMLIMGAIIEQMVQAFKDNPIPIEVSNRAFIQFEFSHWTFLPVPIAIAVMVYKGWQLSRVKHSYLDQNFLKVAIDNQPIGKLNMSEIKAVLLLKNPDAEILVLTHKEAIIIPKLQELEDSQIYLYFLQQGIEFFQK